jgi:hypothetical protein
MRLSTLALTLGTLALATSPALAQDPNFHVYLGFGQSNMEGNAKDFSGQDQVSLPRFQVMSGVNCSNLGRTQGQWAPAKAPLVRCNTGLSVLDYFGRTLVDSLPSTIKIGVVPVAVAGSKIEGFDLSTYQSYYASEAQWMKNIVAEYGGNPYARLVSVAKEAQKSGVIKGILLHQGESNSGDGQWPAKVRKIYLSLLKDLSLDSNKVPLLVGELVNADQGGATAGHNTVIARMPATIKTSYVISSKGCTDIPDNLHFSAAGYREMGKRYAQTMLKLLKTTTAVESREAFETGSASSTGNFVYDLRGNLMGRISATDPVTVDHAWNGMRTRLPNGVYWIRDIATGGSRKVVNGR